MDTLLTANNRSADSISLGLYRKAYYELWEQSDTIVAIMSEDADPTLAKDLMARELSVSSHVLGFDRCAPFLSKTDDTDPLFNFPFQVFPSCAISGSDVNSSSYVCATALFNLALACHLESRVPACCANRRNRLLRQCKILYLASHEMATKQHSPPIIILMALTNNMTELSMEEADLASGCYWRDNISLLLRYKGDTLPRKLFVHFLHATIYYCPDLLAARAA
jgi:hypothetical protein